MNATRNGVWHGCNRLLAQTRSRIGGLFSDNQVLGHTRTIGCVAVEVTQRCNLDCALCYLSEHSESVRDLPLAEIFRRLDTVVSHFGAGTHVQITGGDPALRKHTELIEIVRYASNLGLYPALFTNGIAATRKLLEDLARAGLCDVAFHVDTTQHRQSYDSELGLNTLRREYIDRVRDLGLMVIFNTTVYRGNFSELPDLVRFFAANADVVGLASFQLQADTGRGEWGKRDTIISQESVRSQIEAGAGRILPWGVVQIGHPDCHSYLPAVVVNRRLHPVIEDSRLFGRFLRDFRHVNADRHFPVPALIRAYLFALLYQPRWWLPALRYLGNRLRGMWRDLITGRFRIHKLSFFIQNFMDAGNLVQERIDACSFMVMTADGPVSMCRHNANRDAYILKPINIRRADGRLVRFDPLSSGRRTGGATLKPETPS